MCVKVYAAMSEQVPWDMCPAKFQISLRIHAVCSESSLGAFWIVKDAKFIHAHNEDSDQAAWMPRLI